MNNDESILKDGVRMTQTVFGKSIDIPGHVIVVCIQTDVGLRPIRISLSHQLYERTVNDLLEQYPDATGVVAIPYKSEDVVHVTGDVDKWRRFARAAKSVAQPIAAASPTEGRDTADGPTVGSATDAPK